MAEPSISQLVAGMNNDSVASQLKGAEYTYALNAVIENFDGNMLTIQNEQANTFCFSFPSGYKVIAAENIPHQDRVLIFLTNPTTGDSEIGFGHLNDCIYETSISDVGNCKLGFDINHPVHKIIIKSTNCSTQAYWTDGLNPRRYIDFDDMPWIEEIDPDNSFKRVKLVGQLDCNKLNVQPNFSIPRISGEDETVGGSLVTGVYQGAVQYANALGEGQSAVYNITNPISIFEQKESVDFNLPTAKAITFVISDLDQTGLYEYFNLLVIKTINLITTVEVVGTFPISNPTYTYTYTGEVKGLKTLNIEDVFLKYPYYDVAQDIFSVDNVIGWAVLKELEEKNYQPFWSKVELMWESFKLPYNQFQAYNNGINSEKYRSYMGDEVYPLEGCLLLTNGKQTKSYHIPGRIANAFDLEIINTNNWDNAFSTIDKCEPPLPKPRWKVYNTASELGRITTDDNCYIGPYAWGQFAYWESAELYPNNREIWGDLANKPIRHHKFPDCLVRPIHDNNVDNDLSFEHSIYPVGIKIDAAKFIQALKETLTPTEIAQIAGFKITRGDRVVNKSIIAKGLLHNVGVSIYDGKEYLYPNYPFNDLRPDPYFSTEKLENHVGYQPQKALHGFNGIVHGQGEKTYTSNDSNTHFTFHSPDTHFYQPSLDNTGEFLKFETIEFGKSNGHFTKIKDNAEYKFLTPKTINAAAGLGLASGIIIGAGTFGWPNYNMASTVPTYTATIELFERLAPFLNFGYNFNSTGNYSNSFKIPNSGDKQRGITYNRYVTDGLNGVEDGRILNNFRRESAVYIATDNPVPFPHEYDSSVPVDNSRYNLASLPDDGKSPETIRTKDISSYYGAIKREVINQWGYIYSYDTIDTGYYQSLRNEDGTFVTSYPTVFGGDTFINRFSYKSKLPFFRDNTVGKIYQNQTDIAYDEVGNLNYPMFWISTKASRYDIDVDNEIEKVRRQFLKPSVFNVISNLFTGGSVGAAVAMSLVGKLFGEIYSKIGLKNVNMDRANSTKLFEEGLFYIFSYGIPYFFCESSVNVDYRQATNQREGDFYPHVGGDIPDDWLQETNVPIIEDNKYTYNKTYSKQNKENLFVHLREDYDPTKTCLREFPNRAIISDPTNLEETKNNWLVYRPSSRFDFPKGYGALISLDGLENRQVLARFENKSLLYNALATAPTSVGQVYLGKPLFDNSIPPMDFAETDNGYVGSQHKFLLKTEIGHVTADAKRGQIFLLRNKAEDITTGMTKFFMEFLKFEINKSFPEYPIDNHFNGCGLHGVYDTKYDRIIVTKIDYKPIQNLLFDGRFYIEKDENYFTTTGGNCCPEGFVRKGDICIKTIRNIAQQDTDTEFVATPVSYSSYSQDGTRVYSSINPDGTGVFTQISTSNPFWTNLDGTSGPLNRLAFWNNTVDYSPADVYVYVSFQISVPEDKTYYVGIAGDNTFGLDVDCEELFNSGVSMTFLTWNIVPVFLTAGSHVIKLKVINQTDPEYVGLNPAAFGVEIYDNTEAELLGSNGYDDINVIFSSADLFGQTLNNFNYSCPGGGCNSVVKEGDNYYCISYETQPVDCKELVRNNKTRKIKEYIDFSNKDYFCNNSFTISYNLKTQSWTSFHSYIPNYYIGDSNRFFSGLNSSPSFWTHNTTINRFNNFYGNLEPYVIEYPIYFKGSDEIIQNVKDYSKILRYTDFQEFVETDDIYFSKAILYNNQQCSGTLKLTKKPKNSISSYNKYPIYHADEKEILYTKSNSFYQFNTFWALQKSSQQPMWLKSCESISVYKELNNENMNYSKRSFNKAPLMSKDTKIRLINDDQDAYKFVSQFIIVPTMTSFK